jgi:predicted nucleic acid-binding protein
VLKGAATLGKPTVEQDPYRATELEIWLNEITDNYSILAMDAAAFRVWATLMHRKPETLTVEAMIAATAIVHRLVVVTRNVRDSRVFEVDTLKSLRYASRPVTVKVR